MRWGFWIPVNFVVCFLLYAMVTPVFVNAGDEDLLKMDLANLMDVQITSAGIGHPGGIGQPWNRNP